jgi:hypothetical protein
MTRLAFRDATQVCRTGTKFLKDGPIANNPDEVGLVSIFENGSLSVPAPNLVYINCNLSLNTDPAIQGAGTLVNDGRIRFREARISETTINNSAGGIIQLFGDGAHIIDNVTLTNQGLVTWEADPMGQNGAFSWSNNTTFFNEGVFDIRCDNDIELITQPGLPPGEKMLLNKGLIKKTAGGLNDTVIKVPFTNNNGTLDLNGYSIKFESSFLQVSGTIKLRNGTLESTLDLVIRDGILSGSGTINANLQMGGSVDLGDTIGRLEINGFFTLTSTGAIRIRVGGSNPGVSFDQIVCSQTVTLQGQPGSGCSVIVDLVGNYTPDPFVPHDFLIGANLNGDFGSVFMPFLNGQANLGEVVCNQILPGRATLRRLR